MKQSLDGIEVLLLDIEGTVCPISFVKDTLFPYALKALPSILQTEWTDADFESYKKAFPESAQASPEAFLAHVEDLTHRDVKIAYLKNLQGYLWETGYKTSAHATPLFPDVPPALESFLSSSFSTPTSKSTSTSTPTTSTRTTTNSSTKRIAIYSSGSIFAQKLLFAHVQVPTQNRTQSHGETTKPETQDLTSKISAWFDTTNAGGKTIPSSYNVITSVLFPPSPSPSPPSAAPTDTTAGKAKADANKILFLSDNTDEVRAALDAGMRAVVVEREGNKPLTGVEREEFDIVLSLDELDLV